MMNWKDVALGFITIGMVSAIAKPSPKPIKRKRLYRRVRKPKVDADTPIWELPNYQLNTPNLNKEEKQFKKFLDEVKELYPDTEIIVKQREPVVNRKRGFLEQAMVHQVDEDTIYMVIPKIKNKERLSFAIHETCHLKYYHQDPRTLGGNLDPYTQELEVEICTRNRMEGKFKYGREIVEILKNYYLN